jgi:hypothetical protein
MATIQPFEGLDGDERRGRAERSFQLCALRVPFAD